MEMVKKNGTLQYTRYYFGSYERTEYANSTYKDHFYIYGGSGLVAIKEVTNAGNRIIYALNDVQGSLMALVDESGSNILEEMSFDAYGRRRNPANWTFNNVNTPDITSRGYTMHEHIDEVKLINMNGRVYDPQLTLFLSPDPIIQDHANPLNYNRYSYAFNNPLKYTDPSGYRFTGRSGRHNHGDFKYYETFDASVGYRGASSHMDGGLSSPNYWWAGYGLADMSYGEHKKATGHTWVENGDGKGVWASSDEYESYFGYQNYYNVLMDIGARLADKNGNVRRNGTKIGGFGNHIFWYDPGTGSYYAGVNSTIKINLAEAMRALTDNKSISKIKSDYWTPSRLKTLEEAGSIEAYCMMVHVNQSIGRNGTKVVVGMAAITVGIIGAVELGTTQVVLRGGSTVLRVVKNLNSKYLNKVFNYRGGAVEFTNKFIEHNGNPIEAAKNFNSMFGGKYGQYAYIASSAAFKTSSIQDGITTVNSNAEMVSSGVTAAFGSMLGNQVGSINTRIGNYVSASYGLIMGNVKIGE